MTQNTKSTTLILCIIAAFAIHIGAVLWIQHLDMDSYLSSHALWENQTSRLQEKEISFEEDVEQKNQELADLFKEITSPKTLETLKYDTHRSETQFEDSNIQDIESNLTSVEMEQEWTPSLEAELLESLPTENFTTMSEVETFTSFREITKLDIMYPQEAVANELIKATEAMEGMVEKQAPAEVPTAQVINIGKMEDSSILGTTLQSRSGLMDEGKEDSPVGQAGSLLGSSDFDKVTANGPSNVSETTNKISKEVSLPEKNKNSLRGFDPKSLGAMASSDDFTLKVEYAPSREGGYLFKLELVPKPEVKFKGITQNIFFLVDRSHSIRFQRYEMTKLAVAKSLALLNATDRFNILVFDDEISPFSQDSVPLTPANIAAGREFISRQKYGGVFATTDLYSSIGKIVPDLVPENEVNTAILLSDGDTYLSPEKQRETIAKWTRQNQGKVSLYCLASGRGNNLALLDLLSVFNKGTLHYATTDKGLEVALFKLLQTIKTPIGKEMTVSAVTNKPELKVSLFPANNFLPNLYQDTPYVVYGKVNKLDKFHVFFQGKYYDNVLDIKQEVSFEKASKADLVALEKKLAQLQAYESYNQFLKDGKAFHLHRVKQLLQPHKLPLAFQ